MLSREGDDAGHGGYRWYNDSVEVFPEGREQLMSFTDAWAKPHWGSRLSQAAYILVYVRECHWGEQVGDGTESTPYLRDAHADSVAKSFFRGEPCL